jgi:DNA primase
MTGDCGDVQGSPKNRRVSTGSVTFPRPRDTSPRRSYSIHDIKERLNSAHIHALCQNWLPAGKKQGGWWVSITPWREDRNPSLGVSLTTGHWRDFATGERGDMLDLSMKLFGGTMADTIKGFAEMLGLDRA